MRSASRTGLHLGLLLADLSAQSSDRATCRFFPPQVERLLLDDADPDSGFLLNVDSKWSTHPDCATVPREQWKAHAAVKRLYCLGIVHRRVGLRRISSPATPRARRSLSATPPCIRWLNAHSVAFPPQERRSISSGPARRAPPPPQKHEGERPAGHRRRVRPGARPGVRRPRRPACAVCFSRCPRVLAAES